MKTFVLFLTVFLFTATIHGYAQFRSLEVQADDISQQAIQLRLTPEMFSDQLIVPDLAPHRLDLVTIPETKASQAVLFLGSEILRKRFDFGFFIPAPYPRTVTEYNNAVRRQMFDAEPTSQQRNQIPLFRFN
jgi:hypothetical protein